MERVSHREYLGWKYFLEQPDRSDWYQMQTAYYIGGVFSGKEYFKQVDISDFKLSFKEVPLGKTSKGEKPAVAHDACWFAALGIPMTGVNHG